MRNMAESLMESHSLLDHGWKFAFDRAKTRCGCTDYATKTISISTYFAEDTSVAFGDIVETVLHEIAHALAGYEAGHGPLWKATAHAIGSNGETYNTTWKGPPRRYNITCMCGRVCTSRHVVQRRLARKRCITCNTLAVIDGQNYS